MTGERDSGLLSDHFYTERLSDVSKARKPSPIWDLFPLESQTDMISMLAGKPHPATFPFDYITLGFKTPENQNSPRQNAIGPSGSSSTSFNLGQSSSEPRATTTEVTLKNEDLAMALQYSATAGIPELVEWVEALMDEIHMTRCPTERETLAQGEASGTGRQKHVGTAENRSWRVSLGPGSQDLLYKTFSALLNPGDTIIVEGPTYPTIIPLLDALKCNYAIVEADEEGISASSLADLLTNWDSGSKPFPKVLYTVPFGSNPAGITTSHQRRLEVLSLARKHDIMIIEDDPYFFLYYGQQPKPPSYFELEGESGWRGRGRVVRLDSFSKIVSAGIRLGWVTGPVMVITAIERHNASTVVQPSSLSQVVVLKLLQLWTTRGFMEHTERTARFYQQRRDMMERCLEKHFQRVSSREGEERRNKRSSSRASHTAVQGELKPKAEWITPDASMFFWVKLHLPSRRSADFNSFVKTSAVPHGVLVLPGYTAFPDERDTACVRLSFSLVGDEEMDEGVRRLADAVRSLRTRTSAPSPVEVTEPRTPERSPKCDSSRTRIRDSGISIPLVGESPKSPAKLKRRVTLSREEMATKPLPPLPTTVIPMPYSASASGSSGEAQPANATLYLSAHSKTVHRSSSFFQSLDPEAIQEVARSKEAEESEVTHLGFGSKEGPDQWKCATPTPTLTLSSPTGRAADSRSRPASMQQHQHQHQLQQPYCNDVPSKGKRLSRVASSLGFFKLLPNSNTTAFGNDALRHDSSDRDSDDDDIDWMHARSATGITRRMKAEEIVRSGVVRLKASVVSLREGAVGRGGSIRRKLRKTRSRYYGADGLGDDRCYRSEWKT